ncbi:Gag-Pol polyprotein, partial [Mucuna pruriens]
MKCLSSLCYFVKFFMYEVLILWGHSRLPAVDYVSRWIEAKATRADDAKTVVKILKSNIFYRFGVLKALINDHGSHFCNCVMAMVVEKYGVVHQIAIVYHPQTNDQVEVFNMEFKKLLQKMVNPSQNDWSHLLEDTLWTYKTAYQTPLRMSPYWFVFDKACYLSVEIEHQLTRRSRSAIWPMTKPAESENCSCRSWRSHA